MTENFPNLGKDKDTQVLEAERVPKQVTPKKLTPRYIIIKMQGLMTRRKNKPQKKSR